MSPPELQRAAADRPRHANDRRGVNPAVPGAHVFAYLRGDEVPVAQLRRFCDVHDVSLGSDTGRTYCGCGDE